MLETPHVIVGAAIATKITNPWLSLPIALISHFVLDMTPHWNPHLNTELATNGKVTKRSTIIVVLDVIVAIIATILISTTAITQAGVFYIFLGGFLGVLPDVIEGPYFFLGMRSKWAKKWIGIQKSIQNDTTILPGLLTQIVTIFLALWWVFV